MKKKEEEVVVVYVASMEEDNEFQEDKYKDLMQAFIAEALIADTPTKKDDQWYLNTKATHHLTLLYAWPD